MAHAAEDVQGMGAGHWRLAMDLCVGMLDNLVGAGRENAHE